MTWRYKFTFEEAKKKCEEYNLYWHPGQELYAVIEPDKTTGFTRLLFRREVTLQPSEFKVDDLYMPWMTYNDMNKFIEKYNPFNLRVFKLPYLRSPFKIKVQGYKGDVLLCASKDIYKSRIIGLLKDMKISLEEANEHLEKEVTVMQNIISHLIHDGEIDYDMYEYLAIPRIRKVMGEEKRAISVTNRECYLLGNFKEDELKVTIEEMNVLICNDIEYCLRYQTA